MAVIHLLKRILSQFRFFSPYVVIDSYYYIVDTNTLQSAWLFQEPRFVDSLLNISLFPYCEWNLHCNHCFIYLNHLVIVVLQHALQANWKNSCMDIIQTIRINGGVV